MSHPSTILQISAADQKGGAASIAWELHQFYRQQGLDAWMSVGEKTSADPRVLGINNDLPPDAQPGRGLYRLGRRLERSGWKFGRLLVKLSRPLDYSARFLGKDDFYYPGSRRLPDPAAPRPDLVHVHNLHGGYFDLRVLPALSRNTPLVLTLHDAWLFSGHCAYFLDCQRWKTGCGHCPTLYTIPAVRFDFTASNWKQKRDILANSRIYAASPSAWLLEKARQSILAPALRLARVIPNGIDTSLFTPGDLLAARRKLNIPPEAQVVFFAAHRARTNSYKGFPFFQQVFHLLASQNPEKPLLFLVAGDTGPSEFVGNSELRFLPLLAPAEMPIYYRASDIYAHTARADNFPGTVLEALACGKPVVGNAVGGLPEQVREGVTGFLTPPDNAPEFAGRILQLLQDAPLRRQMGEQAAEDARRRFSLQRMASDYLDFYREVCEDA